MPSPALTCLWCDSLSSSCRPAASSASKRCETFASSLRSRSMRRVFHTVGSRSTALLPAAKPAQRESSAISYSPLVADRTRLLRISFAAVIALGATRIGSYYLFHELVANARQSDVGAEFQPIEPLIHAPRVAYLSDEALDADPRQPRVHDRGDMMYARAQ